MNPVIAFIKLIRWPNLLIIILTQYLMRWCIIQPMVEIQGDGFQLQISEFSFFLLVLSTVMIAAAGNIINDYFDIKIDNINKPEKVIVGKYIKRRVAMGAHIVINVIAILIGGIMSHKIGNWELVSIHIFSAMSLWYYATHFKHMELLGNFVIALLAGLVPLTVGLYEIPLLNTNYADILAENNGNFNFIAFWIIGYSVFAFLLTLSREITKDIADVEGDKAFNSNTMVVSWGKNLSSKIVLGINGIAAVLLIYIYNTFLTGDKLSLLYLIICLLLPLIYASYLILKIENRKQALRVSTLSKLIALFGILYAIIVKYTVLSGAPLL